LLALRLFFLAPPCTELSTLSLHDALPISSVSDSASCVARTSRPADVISVEDRIDARAPSHLSSESIAAEIDSDSWKLARCTTERSEEHTSELQSREKLVCRLLLEKKNTNT